MRMQVQMSSSTISIQNIHVAPPSERHEKVLNMPPKKKFRRDKSKQEWRKQQFKGGGYRKGNKKADASSGGGGEGASSTRGAGYTIIVKENALLEKHYKDQGFIPEDEWDQFISIMKEDLPATFRITGSRRIAEHVRSCLEMKYFRELSKLEVEGEMVPPPQPIKWYPNNLAWHVSLTRKFIRKSDLVSKFHTFLVKENEQGNISRQEAVSMIPPLLLDVKPHHKVLDMCAAPGSKTAQLIEFLHAEDTETNTFPSGVIVANDADNKRCYMLVHQAKRLNSPSFMVTNHDASVFPMLYYHDENDVRHPLYYDRVLCDVPCSGDGTLRKNPVIWKNWKPSMGPALHKMQLRILHRGLELLSPGGRLVYSTCSLNPVEDEAIIATALTLCKGMVELVDCADRLEGLKRISGLTTWKVMAKDGEWIGSAAEVPKSNRCHLKDTMFPPTPEDATSLHLDRCMRVLPHHQDTGGFFIAVLEKKDWLPWQRKQKRTQKSTATETKTATMEDVEDLPDLGSSSDITAVPKLQDLAYKAATCTSAELPKEAKEKIINSGSSASVGPAEYDTNNDGSERTSDTVGNGGSIPDDGEMKSKLECSGGQERPSKAVLGKPGYRQRKGRQFREDPYVFLDKDSDVYDAVGPYFGLANTFPSDQLLVRTYTGKKRNIYLASRLVKELTLRNESVLRIVNIGVKVMARCDHVKTSCDFRLCQEGVDTMVPYVSAHRVRVIQKDLMTILSEANPLTSSLSQLAQQSIQQLGTGLGPVIFMYSPEDTTMDAPSKGTEGIALNCPIYLSGWVAAKSVRLYVDKNYRYHYLSILGHDPPANQSLETISGKMRDWDMDCDVDSGEEGEQRKAPDEPPQEIEEDSPENIDKN